MALTRTPGHGGRSPNGPRKSGDTENIALLEHWTAELFGEHGTLVDQLR
jgi:hypothetical protein